MIENWFKEDIEHILAEHRYVVVTDANSEGCFLLKYLPADINPLKAHPDYPFAELDRKVMKMLSKGLKLQRDTTAIVSYIKTRTTSKKAKAFKPAWLDSVLTLSAFSIKGLNSVTDYSQMAEFYLQNFAKLDTAMRKIYVAWLNDEPTLRPLQEHYTQFNKELLTKWYAIGGDYIPHPDKRMGVFPVSDWKIRVIGI